MVRITLSVLAAALVCLSSATFVTPTSADPYYRNPVVLSIAPDEIDCDNPDGGQTEEDVLIAGLCFFDDITSAYLTLNPDGSGSQVPLTNVVNASHNIVTATVPLNQFTERDSPYYVFVVRGTDGKRSTAFPNAFGFDVTFTCISTANGGDPGQLTSCRVVRQDGGRLVLQVTGAGLRANDSVILINGQPCAKMKYPSRFVQSDGTTTRIDCHGKIKQLLPAVVTVRNTSTGQTLENSLTCGLE